MKAIKLTDHIVICNYVSLDKTLTLVNEIRKDRATRSCHLVIVDDEIQELPSELQADDIHFVRGNPCHEAVLLKANVKNCRSVIVQAAASDPRHADSDNLKVLLMIETLNPSVYTVVECIEPSNQVFFKRANCDSVVCIASLSGQMLVQEMQDPGVSSVVSELTSNMCSKQFYVMGVGEVAGKAYQDLSRDMAAKGALLMGIRRGETNHLLPAADFALQTADKAIFIADERPQTVA